MLGCWSNPGVTHRYPVVTVLLGDLPGIQLFYAPFGACDLEYLLNRLEIVV